jgi:hypothetical protein
MFAFCLCLYHCSALEKLRGYLHMAQVALDSADTIYYERRGSP